VRVVLHMHLIITHSFRCLIAKNKIQNLYMASIFKSYNHDTHYGNSNKVNGVQIKSVLPGL